MICPDKTLEHLAQAQPATLDSLGAIYGLGEAKVARFGAELIEVLRLALSEMQSDEEKQQ